MEHYRPKMGNVPGGYYQGYYCGRCGAPGLSMMGRCSKHTVSVEKWDNVSGTWIDVPVKKGICLANPKLVKLLNEANTVEAEKKRVFKRKLRYGEKQSKWDWEVEL